MFGGGEVELLGVVVLVVDEDDGAVGPVEHGGGDGGSVAGSAVHPYFAVGDLAGAVDEFVQGDVDGAGDVARVVLVCAGGRRAR